MKIKVLHTGGFGVDAVTIPGPFHSLTEVKQANKRIGHHFFGSGEMQFFDSKPLRTIYHGRFFIDSCQFHGSESSSPREYKVYLVMDDGAIHHVCVPPEDWDGEPERSIRNTIKDAGFTDKGLAKLFAKKIVPIMTGEGKWEQRDKDLVRIS